MQKFLRFTFSLLILLNFSSTALGSDPLIKKKVSKPYNLSIVAIFKNEADYFKEWLEYHLLVGVDHFYLYDNRSTDTSKEVLDPYIKAGKVTLVDWPDQVSEEWKDQVYNWVHHTQTTAYEHALKGKALKETKWLAIIDIDEFLLPTEKATMGEVLADYENYPALCAFWEIYGTSNVYELPENSLLIESLQMKGISTDTLNVSCPKMIVKPEWYLLFSWPPHYCLVKGGILPFELDKSVLRINHYLNRTVVYFYECKIKNKEHMNNKKMSEDEINQWINVGNVLQDEELIIFRYVPELRKRMGFDNDKIN